MAEFWGQGVVLRAVRLEDRPLVERWLADQDLRRYTGRRVSSGLGVNWTTAPHDSEFLILLREGRRPIGLCGLYGISSHEGIAEVGIFLGDKDTWGHGYGPEALRLLLDHAYGDLGLREVALCVHAANSRAIRAYEKVGFAVERRLTVGRWLFGHGVEVLVMTACAPAAGGVMAQGGSR
ncbi:TPA: hypothetical protein DCY65_00535 [Candidatus Acetothermia bacterium]|nr:hypothetical protein [Candidatus Acetothermia bacterium]HAZ30050.1 hypothetical protein [Candidatus Acetothermia bacterium]